MLTADHKTYLLWDTLACDSPHLILAITAKLSAVWYTFRHFRPWCIPACNSPPITYFMLLFTVGTMKTVLHNTVACAEVVFHDIAAWLVDHPNSRMKRWMITDITMKTLKPYLGMCINMSLIWTKKAKDYWLRQNPSQLTPYFGQVMCYQKFALMQCMFHVGILDATPHGQANSHPWSKVRPVLDVFNRTFQDLLQASSVYDHWLEYGEHDKT